VTQLEPRRPRDVAALFRDPLRVFFRHFWLFVALSAAVVVPVELIVRGIGMEMLTSSYDDSVGAAEVVVPVAVQFLVVMPIVTAICIHALDAIVRGERPRAGQVLTAGFEAFTPLFAAVVLAAIGIGLVIYGLVKRFEKHLKTGEMGPGTRKLARRLGIAGYVAKGVAYGISGLLIILAAVNYDPEKARGLDVALRTLREQSYGQVLLTVVALGIAAFGVFCLLQSRYRKV
jgi:hypothetical protein